MDLSILNKEQLKEKAKEMVKSPVFWGKVVGALLPLCFVAYVVYLNFLPLGYNKSFTVIVGSKEDTNFSEFYLEPSINLSERKNTPDGTPYRDFSGTADAVFKTKALLENAEATIQVIGEDVCLIEPTFEINQASIQWDNFWNFEKEIPKDLKNLGVFTFDGKAYFDGASSLEFTTSTDKFEAQPFTAYAEWTPLDSGKDFQEIIGHYNWELVQNKNSVQFQVGRMNNATGTTYSIVYPVSEEFFNKTHRALAVYNPSDNGHIFLYVDGKFVGSQNIKMDKIWTDYITNNLSIGWSKHNSGKSPHFKGFIYKAGIVNKNLLPMNRLELTTTIQHAETAVFHILANRTTSTLQRISLTVLKK